MPTLNRCPDVWVLVTTGSTPELSVAMGSCHVTGMLVVPRGISLTVFSGQKSTRGGVVSGWVPAGGYKQEEIWLWLLHVQNNMISMSACEVTLIPQWAEYSPTEFWIETNWELGGGIMIGFTHICYLCGVTSCGERLSKDFVHKLKACLFSCLNNNNTIMIHLSRWDQHLPDKG